ncbi:restriction endonuclease subunit R [Deinococcus psychrotolerans]|uniref:Restriction endonuclease subunit R n=1 Tax=Deinococcus psychrotolerans TaxID=2489213 RepID=A0A3G8YLD7_9DEIO|nr:type I restriction-modification enzyme R subunit C-terminal domain-containing protein [Deinococcus psychrotolerans]AZI43434.1 restriction endonuclease subunit R [Deinococcus psychrotolerans]
MKPEEQARLLIDAQLRAAGWAVQDYKAANLFAAGGVALREVPTAAGPCDYMLFWKGKAIGIVEAKPKGTSLTGVSEQTDKYSTGLPEHIKKYAEPLPFAYEANGHEVRFRDRRDPESRSRGVFAFHQPDTLGGWFKQANTLRERLRHFLPLSHKGLRDAQFEAITHLEESFGADRPRALIQMTMGSGKSVTAVASSYRLLKDAGAKRVLFLVDRDNLGKQALGEFTNFTTPDDGRKFTELYKVQHLKSNLIDDNSQVVITTIQRLYSMLRGEAEYEEGNEERSAYELESDQNTERLVSYNSAIPIETFDFMIADECHRSIYGTWRQVLEYFDAFLVGLTATPDARTIGFFNKNLVMEYGHERAVADGVNVPFDVYRLRTRIGEQGATVAAGEFLDYKDRYTGKKELRQLGDNFDYAPAQLDRSVVAVDQIRTVIREYKNTVLPLVFPKREFVPKTLIFAKTDAHADDIVEMVRLEFGKGNDFCKKITYGVTGVSTDTLIKQFRNDFNPRVVVTVDMIATGTDIKALEVLLFMRDVKSRSYFDQMKGRGTRVIDKGELQKVSSDAPHKDFFLLIDAVGVTESDKSEARPLEQQRSVSLEKLLQAVGFGGADAATLSSLAGRLARINSSLTPTQRSEIEAQAGQPISQLIGQLLNAASPDAVQARAAQNVTAGQSVTEADLQDAADELRYEASKPFGKPELRDLIVATARKNEVVIDIVTMDEVLPGQHVLREDDATRQHRLAEGRIGTFKAFIEAHKDDIDALSIIYSQPYRQRHLTFRQIKELSKALEKQDAHLTPETLYADYALLDAGKVSGQAARRALADLVALVRYAAGQADMLEPFGQTVTARFERWLSVQAAAGRAFSDEQLRWLHLIRDQIAVDLTIEETALYEMPFDSLGGLKQARAVFGEDALRKLLDELNLELAA